MRNGIIAGTIALVGVGSAVMINNNSKSEDTYTRNDNPSVERSYKEYGDKDCQDFSSQDEAQEFFESEGGPDDDFHNLDRDGDGVVCESLK
jgi:Excalibur calcium-binding domain